MKGKRKMGIFLIFICLLFFCRPVRAQEGSAVMTVTVPEQPENEMEASAGDQILDDVSLPEGWEWKEGSISLKPGGSVTGTAVYRDKNGSILVEREIVVAAPIQENTKDQALSDNGSTRGGNEEAEISVKVPQKAADAAATASGTGQRAGTKTGDEADAALWIVVVLLSLGILLAAFVRRQRDGMGDDGRRE